jgi:hypothetical protein
MGASNFIWTLSGNIARDYLVESHPTQEFAEHGLLFISLEFLRGDQQPGNVIVQFPNLVQKLFRDGTDMGVLEVLRAMDGDLDGIVHS